MASTSRFLNLPPELRDQIYTLIGLSVLPFQIKRGLQTEEKGGLVVSPKGSGLLQTCRQTRCEYSSILKELALSPDVKIATAVYGFDFTHLTAFIKTLSDKQVALASRHGSITAHLFIVNIGREEAANMLGWLRTCDETGIDVQYVLQWSTYVLSDFCALERILTGHREGPKIWMAVGACSMARRTQQMCAPSAGQWLATGVTQYK